MRIGLAFLLAALVLLVGCDHGTKHWAETSLRGAPRSLVAGVLELSYAANHDNAFSLTRHLLPAPIKRPVLLTAGVIGLVFVASLW